AARHRCANAGRYAFLWQTGGRESRRRSCVAYYAYNRRPLHLSRSLRYRLRTTRRGWHLPQKQRSKPGKGKRHPLNMRTTKEVRELLERAAAESGRSLVQEVEHRLETSFRDDAFFQFAGDAVTQKIIRPIVYYLGILRHRDLDWRSNPDATQAVRDS